jgi:UDP-N-acetylmuramate--alanine ligase
VEADEYDRSFHWLHPWIAIITAVDPDHLDIYGTPEAYRDSFEHFTSLIRPEGFLIMKKGLNIIPRCHNSVRIFTYSESEGDYHAKNVRIRDGAIKFDFVAPDLVIPDIWLGVPVKINIENAVAALAAAMLAGVTPEEARSAMTSFAGAGRRFQLRGEVNGITIFDDYAHHPDEIAASVASIRMLYPDKKITGVFQPHLYSRTRDFAPEFARSLSKLDEVILLDIYPAREEPIEGVTSKIIFDRIDNARKIMCSKAQLLDVLRNRPIEVLVTLGAGDIDRMLPDIEKVLKEK